MNWVKKALGFKQKVHDSLSSDLIELNISIQGIETDRLYRIINSTCSELVAMLNNSETTSVQLIRIFSFRAATIGKQLEAITQNNFQQALKIALECDEFRKNKNWKNKTMQNQEQDAFPPLFGIPISVKDAFLMKNFSSTLGLVHKFQQKSDNDGQFIQVLKKAGLIPFVRTNVPTLLSTYSTGNSIWGIAKNPWDTTRTPGGSSGGEASLIASKCSPLGIGSDIGGSLRNPAEFCGIYTIKPCSQRVSVKGHASFAPSIDAQTNIQCAIGPLARSVQDLALFMKIVCDKNYYTSKLKDHYKKIIPFDAKLYKNISNNKISLKIGYFDTLDICPSTEPSRRAVKIVVDSLKLKGHTLEQLKIPNSEQYIGFLMTQVFVEGLKGHMQVFGGQPLTKDYQALRMISKIPRWLHWIVTKILKITNPRMQLILRNSRQLSAHDYIVATSKLQNFRRQFYKMWIDKELDFIICPGFHCQATKIQHQHPLGVYPAVYNYMWNILDYPVGSVPITLSQQQQIKDYQYKYNDEFTQMIKLNQNDAINLPVGVQVVGLPFEEEKVLGLMKLIEKEVEFTKKHPYPF